MRCGGQHVGEGARESTPVCFVTSTELPCVQDFMRFCLFVWGGKWGGGTGDGQVGAEAAGVLVLPGGKKGE